MKKHLLTILLILLTQVLFAQWTNSNNSNNINNTNSGNVGIGTTTPVDKLEINVGANRQGLTITSDGNANAYTDINFSIGNTSAIIAGDPISWQISHRKDGYFSGTTNGKSSLEFYANLKGGNYYAPLSFKSDGNVILVSTKNALNGKVGVGTVIA